MAPSLVSGGLWHSCTCRGPCAPSFSGRQHDTSYASLRRITEPRRVQTNISANASLGPSSVAIETPAAASSTSTRSVEALEDDSFMLNPVGLSSSKPLKINLDLRLYRARLCRLQACLSTDRESRRLLLREAEASLRMCLAMDASDARTYVVLGKLLVQQKRYDEARKLYADGTTATGNTSPYIWSAWGYLESVTGNVSRARKLFDAAIVVDGSHAAAWHKWGMLEMRQGNYLRARDLWTTGINRCRRVSTRSSTYLYCSLAVMAAELGKLSEARAWFQEGTRLAEGRSSAALWHAWAMTEAHLGDASAVRYLFKRTLQVHPRSRYAHLAWAMWERRQGNIGACRQLLARGSSLNPADAALYQARGIVEKEAGHIADARAAFKQGLTVDSCHLHLWQAWGVMEYQLGNFDEARRLFQEGVWADPGNKDVVYIFQAWGVLERAAGNAPLARELFKAALRVDPKNESTWATWIQMEEDLGRLEAANELRIRRSEQQWEFVIPASFSTRPAGSSSFADAANEGGTVGLLNSLMGTLNRFFSMRARPAEQETAVAAASWNGAHGQQQLMHDLRSADYQADSTLEDIISEASALDAGGIACSSAASSRSSTTDGTRSTSMDSPIILAPTSQYPCWSDDMSSAPTVAPVPAPSNADGSSMGQRGNDGSSTVIGEVFAKQWKQDRTHREMGLQQRPTRPAAGR